MEREEGERVMGEGGRGKGKRGGGRKGREGKKNGRVEVRLYNQNTAELDLCIKFFFPHH